MTDKTELEIVRRYLEEHFDPIRRLLGDRIPDPEVRAIAIRRCTRHIFHWKREVLGDQVGPDHPDYGEPGKPSVNNGRNHEAEISGDEQDDVPADQRPPEQWATGGDPATPKQLAVLKDRGIGVPEDVTKARASQLISEHVYGEA